MFEIEKFVKLFWMRWKNLPHNSVNNLDVHLNNCRQLIIDVRIITFAVFFFAN